jgi:hypothetical protein
MRRAIYAACAVLALIAGALWGPWGGARIEVISISARATAGGVWNESETLTGHLKHSCNGRRACSVKVWTFSASPIDQVQVLYACLESGRREVQPVALFDEGGELAEVSLRCSWANAAAVSDFIDDVL